MKSSPYPILGTLGIAVALLSGANAPLVAENCRYMDNYGIYKVCDPPPGQHAEHHETIVQTIYVPDPQPFATPAPVMQPAPAMPDPMPTPIPTPPTPIVNDDSRRELTAVNAKLHQLHLLLVDKQNSGDIAANLYEEENRYLAQIEREAQSDADARGGYLTVAQENTFLQQLQQVETEINQNVTTNNNI